MSNSTQQNKIIIKFEQVADHSGDLVRRISGFVQAKYLVDLITISELKANPRSAKVSNITDDIIESIEKSAEIFQYKTKGLLLASSAMPRSLERDRYEFEFKDNTIEGILDGGHNTLAIALHILKLATANFSAVNKIKRWADMKALWNAHKSEIAKVRDKLNFLVPVEVLVPANDSEEATVEFCSSILDICGARNNNAQLVIDTKANQAGHFDAIKAAIDPKLTDQIIWKGNEAGRVPVRDLVALCWIPLQLIELPKDISKISPTQIYSSKGKCMEAFEDLLSHDNVSQKTGTAFTLKDEGIRSALNLIKDLPRLYDKIYVHFPKAYNEAGGKFGRINEVTQYDKDSGKKQPVSKFYATPVDNDYPDGYILPLVCGLSALIGEKDGKLYWLTDPDKFLDKHLNTIVKDYKGVLDFAKWDPQKVGKNALSYTMSKQLFGVSLTSQNLKAA